jgi:hypothetical protein
MTDLTQYQKENPWRQYLRQKYKTTKLEDEYITLYENPFKQSLKEKITLLVTGTDKQVLNNYKFSNLFLYDLDENISGINKDFFSGDTTEEYKKEYIDIVITLLSSDVKDGYIPSSLKTYSLEAASKFLKTE